MKAIVEGAPLEGGGIVLFEDVVKAIAANTDSFFRVAQAYLTTESAVEELKDQVMVEGKHPYEDNAHELTVVEIPGAESLE
eukprot:2440633-Prorocentrum_lima.AAC.1